MTNNRKSGEADTVLFFVQYGMNKYNVHSYLKYRFERMAWDYVCINNFGVCDGALGAVLGIWRGIRHPIQLTDSGFMPFLISGLTLITIGLALIKTVPHWLMLGAIWITAASVIVYLLGFGWSFLVSASIIVLVLGVGVWLTLVLKK